MPTQITTLSENTASRGTGVLAEWGLSILVETDGHKIIFDTGGSFSTASNVVEMGINLSRVDKIIFSHGHMDHTGGLLPLLKLIRKPVEIIAHPDIWDNKYVKSPGEQERYIGIPFRREAAEGLGAHFKLTAEPVWLSESIVTSGEIPMITDYETIDSVLYIKENDNFKPDPLRDDLALFIKSPQGLIVILGCAHRGIINTLKHAQNITGVEPIYAVIGGTHLMSASPQRMDLTIAALRNMGIQKLGVSHCTGMAASAILAQAFRDKFFFNNAGTSLTL
jgi:7,8-dihydropterin-6-yl-methyl-4-(beta-D-ribofuranosyl)aminobenzene 5'-phosphate synthase